MQLGGLVLFGGPKLLPWVPGKPPLCVWFSTPSCVGAQAGVHV